MINFAKLKDIREDHDISQAKMAEILGTTRSAYSLWELGINIIPLNYLCEYADYFNLSLDYILGLTIKNKKSIKKGLDFKVLGENLKKTRINNNLSQENIANILGVTQACIAKYEKGIICISTNNLYKFCKKFNITLNKICGKE